MSLSKARLRALNPDGTVMEDVDVYTSGEAVTLDSGRTLEDIYENDIGTSSGLNTTSKVVIGAINETLGLVNGCEQQVIESTGYGVISGLVVSAQSTPNMTVSVTSGIVYMQTGVRLSSVANNALAISAADPANPRIDIVYITASNAIGYLQGTAASSPVVPSTPANAFLLAQVYVNPGATSITNSNITDKRKIKSTVDGLAALLSYAEYSISAQSIPTGTTTALTLTGTGDSNSIISSGNIKILSPGKYAVSIQLGYDINATGYRDIILTLNGNTVSTSKTSAIIGVETTVSTSRIFTLNANDIISLETTQSSGGLLNVLNSSTMSFVQVRKIG